MKRFFKKALAVVLTVVMLMSVLSTAVFAQETAPEISHIVFNEIEIIENTGGSINYPYEGGYYDYDNPFYEYYWFGDFYYTVHFEDGGSVDASHSNFDYEGYSYYVRYADHQQYDPWGVGTHQVAINVYDYTDSFVFTDNLNVEILPSPIESIDFKPIELIADYDGSKSYVWDNQKEDWDYTKEYFSYNFSDSLSYTVNFREGGSAEGNIYGFYYNDVWYSMQYSDGQSYENPWTVGNTYTIPFDVSELGYKGSFDVKIVDSPIESVTFEPISIIENTDINTRHEYNPETGEDDLEYKAYDWQSKLSYVIEMKNGDRYEGVGTGFWDNDGEWIDFNCEDPQGYNKEWQKDNTYTIPMNIMGYKANATVTITPSPVESIDIKPLSFIEGTNGHIYEDCDPETQEPYSYYRYQWFDKFEYTIKMRNGDVIKDQGYDFEYNDQYCEFEWEDPQNRSNVWKAGDKQTVKVNLWGYEAEIEVSITESPVKNFTIEPIAITQGTCGEMQYGWNPQTYENDLEWFRYNWQNRFKYKIEMQDGTIIEDNDSSFEYKGVEYDVAYSDPQSYENQWTAGNTYTVPVSAMGVTANVQITIEEIAAEEITLGETKDAVISWGGDVAFFAFTPREDGKYIISSTGEGDTYGTIYDSDMKLLKEDDDSNGDSDFRIEYDLKADNTYYICARYYDAAYPNPSATGTFEVFVKQAPAITSIVFEPINIPENTCGEYTIYWDEDTHEYDHNKTYYRYYWWDKLSYTITLKDETEIKGNGTSFEYQDETYHLEYWDNQSYETPWMPNNSYNLSVLVLGNEYRVDVNILGVRVENGFEYMVQGEKAVVVGTQGLGGVLEIPETLGGYPVTAITSLNGFYSEIIIPDSVTSIALNLFYNCYEVKKVTIGAGIELLKNEMFEYLFELEEIEVSEDNQSYVSVDGIVYDADKTKMVAIPYSKTTAHDVPDTATNINLYINGSYKFTINLANSNTGYLKEDGILYNADKTVVYSCDPDVTGSYEMPDSVTTINRCAFMNSNFTEVTISNNVTEIAYYTFAGSVNLEKVTLPSTLTKIGSSAFMGCVNLSEVDLPASLETLEERTFQRTAIKTVNIPSGVKEIGYDAFSDSALQEVTIADGVEIIGSSAFARTGLTEVTVPDSVQEIGSNAFRMTPLKSVDFGSGLKEIYRYAFANTKLTEVDLPQGLERIYDGAFMETQIADLELPDSLLHIGDHAFAKSKIDELVIPESVTNITYKCFEDNENLFSIDISDNLESLDGYAFHGTAWWNSKANGPVYLENALYHYKGTAAAGSSVSIKNGTKLIADFAFENQYYLKSVTIPASVESIGYAAFHKCLGITNFVIAAGNNNFTFQDGILRGNGGEVLWAKPVRIAGAYSLKTNFKYGEAFTIGNAAWIVIENADEDYTYMDISDSWFKQSASKYVSGFNSKKLGNQTVTLKIGNLSYKYTVKVTCDHKKTTYVAAKKSTCTVQGNNAYRKCAACGTVTSGSAKKLALKSHDYEMYKVTKATPSKDGKKYYKCDDCKATKNSIIYKASKISLSTTEYTYNGKAKKPSVKVYDSKGNKISSSYYEVDYAKGRKNVGKYKVKIKLKGKYYDDDKSLYFEINPKETKVSSVTAAKKSLKVKIKKQSTQTTGYQIQYSTSSKFKSAKTKTTKSTSYTIKSLKAKKNYYVRVRTYKTVDGKKYYSDWSKSVKKKTK